MKKSLACVILCALMAFFMSGCFLHSHKESKIWLADTKTHWKVCDDCDEKLQLTEHTLNDDSKCDACGTEVIDFGDFVSITTVDEYGNTVRMAEYDTENKLVTETVYGYEYDADGNIKKLNETIDGLLNYEAEYIMNEGNNIIAKAMQYNEDASKVYNEYDVYGNVTVMIDYAAGGNVNMQTNSEFTKNENGEWYESGRVEFYKDGTKIEATYNGHGDNLSRKLYDAKGNLTTSEIREYTYDANGNKLTEALYENEAIKELKLYRTVTKENETYTFPKEITVYEGDGSKTVSVYNEDDELVGETKYNALGSVIK